MRARDRLREHVERDVADETRVARVGAEVAAAEREEDVAVEPRRLGDHRFHPLAPELVAVAVEEDVDLLIDGGGREDLGIRRPEHRLGVAGAELTEAFEPAFGVRQHEVVLGRIGAVVVVETGVHAAELGQAHRHVAVVEDDRDAEALAQPRRDAAQVAHRDGEDDDRVDVALALEDPGEVAAPARRHVAPDHLARQLVGRRVGRVVLGTSQERVALQPRRHLARRREGLGLPVERVRRRPPPGRLDRAAAVGRDDQVGPGLVQPLPDLPPRGCAAVAEVEVGGRRNREDLRRAHGSQYGDGVRFVSFDAKP